MLRFLNISIAMLVGILVLLGYFITGLESTQILLLNWAMILAGAAALVGIFNLISVHANKIRRREKGAVYSTILLLALIFTFVFGVFLGPDHTSMRVLVQGIVVPAEAMLMGLLTITLLYAAIRLLRRRADVMSLVFLATAVLILFGTATLPFGVGDIPVFGTVRDWVTQVLAVGGARGILIGVALGTLTTGLRVLSGWDRPYGGK
ncbi:MAG: hypothetical protein AB1649_13285 [Chloroflexota bacterium]